MVSERESQKIKKEQTTGTPMPKTYYVHKSNGWRLVVAALDKRGWQQLPFEYSFSTRFMLKWVERRSQIDYKAHVPGQVTLYMLPCIVTVFISYVCTSMCVHSS